MSNRPIEHAPAEGPERYSLRLPWPHRPAAQDAAQGVAGIVALLGGPLGAEAAASCAPWVAEALCAGGTAWHGLNAPAGAVLLTLTLLEDGESACHALLSVEWGCCTASSADRLAAARLDAMIGTAGAICHSVNNTLTALLGNAEMLLDTPGLPEDAMVSAQIVLRAGERLDLLTRQTLELSRARHPAPGRCDPERQLARLAREMAQTSPSGARLDLALVPGLGTLLADPDALDAAISHLVRNAMAAAGDRGSVVLRAEREEVAAWPGFGWLRVTVEDDGPGLPPAELAFPGGGFLTGGRSGGRHALGLASVRAFATALGGRLEAGVGALGGARLVLRLPVLDEREAAP